MRRIRRFAAALFGALLLQVVSLGTGVDCSASRTDSAAGADAHANHPSQAGATASAEATARQTAKDQTPRDHAPAHCPMAMTCAPTALTAVPYAIDEPAGTATLIVARDDVMPPSAAGAPEPPPPRA